MLLPHGIDGCVLCFSAKWLLQSALVMLLPHGIDGCVLCFSAKWLL